MKKVLVLTLFILGISCQKNNTQPAPAPPPATNTTPTNPALTSQEQNLVGNWILDKIEVYVSSNLMGTTLPNDPTNCHLDLMNTYYSPNTTSDWKNNINGLSCTASNAMWRVNNGLLEIPLAYQINTLTATNLILQYGSTGSPNGGQIYYFHK